MQLPNDAIANRLAQLAFPNWPLAIDPFHASAALALAKTWSKPAGSLTAISARSFRSISILAFFSPSMNRLYVRPRSRAAALRRTIQSARKLRLRTRRSRVA